MFHLFSTGQETDEGIIRRAGSSTELLQLHSAGIKRNVPQVLHPLPAFQSPEIPPPVGGSRLAAVLLDISSKLDIGLIPRPPLRIFCNLLERHLTEQYI